MMLVLKQVECHRMSTVSTGSSRLQNRALLQISAPCIHLKCQVGLKSALEWLYFADPSLAPPVGGVHEHHPTKENHHFP